MRFVTVYERQMPDDVPIVIEKSLLIADYYLRALLGDTVRLAALSVLAGIIFDLSQFLNGRPVPSIAELTHGIGPVFIEFLLMMFGFRQIFSRGPLKHRIERTG